MDEGLDEVTIAALNQLRYHVAEADRELNDATVKAKTLRNALFEVEGAAHKAADEKKLRKK